MSPFLSLIRLSQAAAVLITSDDNERQAGKQASWGFVDSLTNSSTHDNRQDRTQSSSVTPYLNVIKLKSEFIARKLEPPELGGGHTHGGPTGVDKMFKSYLLNNVHYFTIPGKQQKGLSYTGTWFSREILKLPQPIHIVKNIILYLLIVHMAFFHRPALLTYGRLPTEKKIEVQNDTDS